MADVLCSSRIEGVAHIVILAMKEGMPEESTLFETWGYFAD